MFGMILGTLQRFKDDAKESKEKVRRVSFGKKNTNENWCKILNLILEEKLLMSRLHWVSLSINNYKLNCQPYLPLCICCHT